MSGTLYLCATPIGNLEDITFRVLRTLKDVDMIAAEDTRNSIKLLNHFEINTPMTSYHEFNKYEKGPKLIEQLLSDKNIALITDAGTPGISDPGEHLVALACDAGITVTSLPGACACITALTASGRPTGRFVFDAFLPTEKKQRAAYITNLQRETRTIVLYEAPHRLVRTLGDLYSALGDRTLTVCRELTKKHETFFRTTLSDALSYYELNSPKGECVLVLEGISEQKLTEEARDSWTALTVEEHLNLYLQQGLDRKDAMKAVAADRGVGKREIYQALLPKDPAGK